MGNLLNALSRSRGLTPVSGTSGASFPKSRQGRIPAPFGSGAVTQTPSRERPAGLRTTRAEPFKGKVTTGRSSRPSILPARKP